MESWSADHERSFRDSRFSEERQNDDNDGEEEVVTLYGATKNTTAIHSKPRRSAEREALDPTSAESGDAGLSENADPDVILLQDQASNRVPHFDESHLVNNLAVPNSLVVTKTFPYKHLWQHPKLRENYRVVLASVLLTLFGACLAVAGVVIEVSQIKNVQSYMFFAAAAICLIPGVYHLVYFYCAIHGVPGFSFNNMPVFK